MESFPKRNIQKGLPLGSVSNFRAVTLQSLHYKDFACSRPFAGLVWIWASFLLIVKNRQIRSLLLMQTGLIGLASAISVSVQNRHIPQIYMRYIYPSSWILSGKLI